MKKVGNIVVLLVDDDPQVLRMLEDIFSDLYTTITASSGREAIEIIRRQDDIAVVVMDIKMPGMDGLTTANEIKTIAPDLAIILHTGYPGDYDEDEIDRTQRPFDYVLKGEPISKLVRSVRNAVESFLLKRDNKLLSQHAESNYGLIGQTPAMRDIYRIISKVSPTDRKIMIMGETGTGKGMVARAIHNNSRRKDERFSVFNCDPQSHDLIDSQLFGHVKGAYTGADSDVMGLFEYTDGGTIFLDEIGDLDLQTQAKLLGVLEEGEFKPLGTPKIKKADVRLLCATNRDLKQLVEEGKFRQDLYFRLKGVKIVMPPLRERKEDIPLLVEKYKDRLTVEEGLTPKRFDSQAIQLLISHEWPGNVRELFEAVESLIVLSDSDIIFDNDVIRYFDDIEMKPLPNGSTSRSLSVRTREFQKTYIAEVLSECNGNVAAAARILKVDPANLRKKIKALDIIAG